jgi:hypothetical protein
MASKDQNMQNPEPVDTGEDEMKRMRDIVGSAVAFQLKPLMEKVADLEGRLAERQQPQQQAQQPQGYPQGQPQGQQGYGQFTQADLAYMASVLEGYGYQPTRGQSAREQPEERGEMDYGEAINEMMDALMDADGTMTRQEARRHARAVVAESEKAGRSIDEVFADKWEAESDPNVSRKVFQPAAIARMNSIWKSRGYQLSPIQQDQQAQLQQPTTGATSAPKPPAIAGRGGQSMPIASQTPTHPPRAGAIPERDRELKDRVQGELNSLDGRG